MSDERRRPLNYCQTCKELDGCKYKKYMIEYECPKFLNRNKVKEVTVLVCPECHSSKIENLGSNAKYGNSFECEDCNCAFKVRRRIK